jgi:IS66 C-terminal element
MGMIAEPVSIAEPPPNSCGHPLPSPKSVTSRTFLGSDRGGRTAAVLYSMTGTCKHHDIDPFAYLQDILGRLPSIPAGQLDALLPDVWFASHPSARRKTAA